MLQVWLTRTNRAALLRAAPGEPAGYFDST
jgi:hypothetical protein